MVLVKPTTVIPWLCLLETPNVVKSLEFWMGCGQLSDENLLTTRRLVQITWAGDGDCVQLRPP
jgi:hypothetical protein